MHKIVIGNFKLNVDKKYKSSRIYNMTNNKNLKLNSERTPKERKELAQKAGIKSGIARRKRKALKDELILLLSQGNIQEKISLAIIAKALTGDVRAFEIIRDTIGEKPIEKQQLLQNKPIIVNSSEDAKLLERLGFDGPIITDDIL